MAALTHFPLHTDSKLLSAQTTTTTPENTFYTTLFPVSAPSRLSLAYTDKWVAFGSQYLYCSWVCCKLMKWWSLPRNTVTALHLPDVRVALKVALRVKLHLGAGSVSLAFTRNIGCPFRSQNALQMHREH